MSHRYSGAAKTEWKLGFTMLSRDRISQRQITEIMERFLSRTYNKYKRGGIHIEGTEKPLKFFYV